jgi:hypothetical protein
MPEILCIDGMINPGHFQNEHSIYRMGMAA